ncbi:MAG: carboxypeptidase-like regulatory domain-containing protein [Planctomycetaceae bacterium]|nr:carboxypeptidase-like regulatory domain-containing protein [Planctomycetaceae bacterium]
MSLYFRLTLFVFLGLFLGCNRSKLPGLYPVKGRITHQGEPLEGVVLNFFPVTTTSESRTATGRSAADGTFTLTTLQTNDGAFPGEYRITLRKLLFSMTEEEIRDIEKSGRNARIESQNIIPEKYQNPMTTELSFTVQAGKNPLCVIDISEELRKTAFPAWSRYEAQKR